MDGKGEEGVSWKPLVLAPAGARRLVQLELVIRIIT